MVATSPPCELLRMIDVIKYHGDTLRFAHPLFQLKTEIGKGIGGRKSRMPHEGEIITSWKKVVEERESPETQQSQETEPDALSETRDNDWDFRNLIVHEYSLDIQEEMPNLGCCS